MATGEPNTDGNVNPPPNLAPVTGSSVPAASAGPSAMPSYPVMIMSAIEALNEASGSNKSSISRQIESTYGDLPPAHATLLTHHLNRMKTTGQLALVKNNYLKPDPNAPPRRGRGRPPKPKPALPAGIPLPSPRPRGRPPKPRDPFAPISSPKMKTDSGPSGGSGRKRGRPPKFPKVGSTQEDDSVGVVVAVTSGPPRGRGRPPKVKPAMAATVGA